MKQKHGGLRFKSSLTKTWPGGRRNAKVQDIVGLTWNKATNPIQTPGLKKAEEKE